MSNLRNYYIISKKETKKEMKQPINFSWKFIPNFKSEYLKSLPKEAKEVNLPHNAVEVPYNYFDESSYQIVSTYEKYFDVDSFDSNRLYFLYFEAFMFKAHIYLNDIDLGEHISGYLPVEIDITKIIKEKSNRLLVVLDSKEDDNYPPFGFVIDYLTFSGIYREVSLISRAKKYIKDIYVRGNLKGEVNVEFTKSEESLNDITYEVYEEDKLITKSDKPNFKVSNIKPWDLDHPNLYTLKIIAEGETYSTRFAFKEVEINNTGLYLNGKKIKLIGLNRHQGYPFMGYAASKSLQIDDANLLKYEVGVNVVRTSHYPQSEHFLNRCDEIGLLIVNEIPGWQHIGEKESWKKACISNTEKMVLAQRNHPCLLCHGVRIDESIDDHELYTKTNEVAHKLDSYHPTIGVRNFTNSELLEDIYGYNDFSCDSLKIGLLNPKKVKTNNKPLLVTEYMGHMDPVKPTSDEPKKIEVALRHAKVIDDNLKYKNTIGAIGWCFLDYQSHVDFGSGDRICPHGVFDLYRNPKYSSYIYSSQQDNFPVLEVLSNMKPGDKPEGIFSDIYVATNCDYVELYKDNELVKKFVPKNDQYKYLKHPPILIDEIVGETFKEDKFPSKSWLKIASMFSYAAMHGFNHLPLKNKIYLGWMMFRYKVSYSELVHYWNKYVGAWGGKAKVYTFKGYKDHKLVLTKEVGPSTKFDMEVSTSKSELVNEDTYDSLRVRIRHVDEHHNVLDYSNRIVRLSVTGPIEIIGPSEQVLLGGQLGVYLKSKNEKGLGKLKIELDNLVKEIEIPVR